MTKKFGFLAILLVASLAYALCPPFIVSSVTVGFGANATGGSFQPTVNVTNLNASGTGSFVAAMGSNRTIKFPGLSGNIVLTSNVFYINHSNFTIDCTTAAGPITFTGTAALYIHKSNNFIVKGCRFKNFVGSDTGPTGGTFSIGRDSFNFRVENISAGNNSSQGALNISDGAHDGTVMNSILSNTAMSVLVSGTSVDTGLKPRNITLYRNLIATGADRAPQVKYDSTISPTLMVDSINNIHLWGDCCEGFLAWKGARVNIVNSYFGRSSYSSSKLKKGIYTCKTGGNPAPNCEVTSGADIARSFISGNKSAGTSTEDNFLNALGSEVSAFTVPYVITPETACAAYATIRANAGARTGGLDADDQTLINSLPASPANCP